MMRRPDPTILYLVALALLDCTSSFCLQGDPVAVARSPRRWRTHNELREGQSRQPSRRLLVARDVHFAGRAVTKTSKTALFFNNHVPDDEPLSTYTEGTSSDGSATRKSKADLTTSSGKAATMEEEEESPISLVDESPQDKILRLRSGKLTSYEKKAFLESALQGSRSIRTPIVSRRRASIRDTPTDRSVLDAAKSARATRPIEKSARATRQIDKYVSRVLDPSRFAVQLARHRQQTAQATNDGPGVAISPDGDNGSASEKPNDDDDALTSSSTQQTTKVDVKQGQDVSTDVLPESDSLDYGKSKRWGVDLDKLKM